MRHPALLLALLVAGTAAAGSWQALVSPAPLSPGHKEFDASCDKCHLVFSGVPNEKCLACHQAIATKVKGEQGFHGDVRGQSCSACHIDHQGPTGKHTSKSALAAFDHQKTTFRLEGLHQAAKCADCHQPAAANARKQLPSASCGACHDDKHDGRLGTSCAPCHNAVGWKDSLKQIAQHETRTDGGHKGLTCTECHAGGRQLQKPGRCISCHESKDAHGGAAISCEKCHQVDAFKPAQHNHDGCTCAFPGKHQTFECIACHKGFNFANTPTLCSGCHEAQRKHEQLGECSRCHSALSWKDSSFDHNAKKSKFPLELKHLEVACSQCHSNTDKAGRTQFRAADKACASCHQQRGDEAHGNFGDCATCHSPQGFTPSTFDHATTGFPLSGRHARATCQSCHAEKTQGYPASGRGASRSAPMSSVTFARWTAVPLAHTAARPSDKNGAASAAAAPHDSGAGASCVHCHADPHKGEVGTSCASCHSTEEWRPSTFTVERHATTAFGLDGKHKKTECSSCHVSGQLKGLPTVCAGCHVDVHRGKLGDTCQSCHSTAAFVPVARFDHTLTGFALSVPHQALDCARCHGDKRDKSLAHVQGPSDCGACHTPSHASFGNACTGCHVATDTTLSAASGTRREDHKKDTGFALERRHALVACTGCHAASQPPAQPLCQSCHRDPHAGGAGMDCADCHRPDRFSMVRFDHNRTAWPLRGRHFMTACNACHVNQTWVGTRSECFDCHARDAARAKQRVGGHAFAPSDCRDCHKSVWRW